jgi:hypothetical protein
MTRRARAAVTHRRSVRRTQSSAFEIQFAADAEWQYTKPENAGIRKDFYLPTDRPFKG